VKAGRQQDLIIASMNAELFGDGVKGAILVQEIAQ
jgi:hypothetical protein